MSKLLIICGPTGSGKTDFAHKIALENNGEIVNCDSMQIYREIPILTASPKQELRNSIQYHLYNFLSVAEEFSVAKYIQLAVSVIQEIINRGKLPILVGGTGMYINFLLYGYNDIPEISSEIRVQARNLHKTLNQEDFFKLLQNIDPQICTKIKPSDTQRTLRAYEVFKQTGKSILSFQSEENILSLTDFDFEIIFLNPARDLLYQLCNTRLIDIFNNGALTEAKNIKDNFLELTTSAAKAIGLKELVSYLNNTISFEEAVVAAQQRTRQYAKSQVTWFKHQIKEKKALEYSNLREFEELKSSFSLEK